jgi:hypothetical protein
LVPPRTDKTDETQPVARIELTKPTKPSCVSFASANPPPCRASPASQALTRAQEAARQQVLAQLAVNPTVQRAFVNRFEDGALIVTLAVRGIGTCELFISTERFNPANFNDYAALLDCLAMAGRA